MWDFIYGSDNGGEGINSQAGPSQIFTESSGTNPQEEMAMNRIMVLATFCKTPGGGGTLRWSGLGDAILNPTDDFDFPPSPPEIQEQQVIWKNHAAVQPVGCRA
ncbi:hypothetical protein GBA52_028391 [Prunus armeniaca]|nr:hypothetical protein GBA52_028391 [Prunus armeniaca]